MNRSCPYCGVNEGEQHPLDCPVVTRNFQDKSCMHCGRRNGEHAKTCAYFDNPLCKPPVTPSALTIRIPPEVEPYAEDIRRFVDAMVYKLGTNAHKGRWDGFPIDKALKRLEEETEELTEALQRGNLVEILLESADVSNFALIIASIAIERGK